MSDGSNMVLTGGCFCGRMRYTTRGRPWNATICHCPDCRRAVGGPMVGWFTVRPSELDFHVDQPRTFASSPGVTRSFCPSCGTSLTYRRERLDEIDVTICSLDEPNALAPEDHTWNEGKLNWVQMSDELPRHPRVRWTPPVAAKEPPPT